MPQLLKIGGRYINAALITSICFFDDAPTDGTWLHLSGGGDRYLDKNESTILKWFFENLGKPFGVTDLDELYENRATIEANLAAMKAAAEAQKAVTQPPPRKRDGKVITMPPRLSQEETEAEP